jgi:hypothetical protein
VFYVLKGKWMVMGKWIEFCRTFCPTTVQYLNLHNPLRYSQHRILVSNIKYTTNDKHTNNNKKEQIIMFSRNTSRDAEQAQDSANFGAPASTMHPRDLQDESGHVTFNQHASAAGSHHMVPNFCQTMAEVVGGLYDNDNDQDGGASVSFALCCRC